MKLPTFVLLLLLLCLSLHAATPLGLTLPNDTSAALRPAREQLERRESECRICEPCAASVSPPPPSSESFTALSDDAFATSGAPHVCVCVRTSERDAKSKALTTVLQSLLAQELRSLDVFLVDIEADQSRTAARRSLLYDTIAQLRDQRIHVARDTRLPADKDMSDATERFLARMTTLVKDDPAHCTHFLVTDSNDYYFPAFLAKQQAYLRNPNAFVVSGTDFVGQAGQPLLDGSATTHRTALIPLQYSEAHFDLGACVLARDVFAQLSFTAARDPSNLPHSHWLFMKSVLARFTPARTVTVSLPLFFSNR